MTVELQIQETKYGKYFELRMVRDEKDKSVVPEPYPRPEKPKPGEYNSWRKDYFLSFQTDEAAAQRALKKVQEIGDFDKAAAWLDKQ
jgi:hypothetical protein